MTKKLQQIDETTVVTAVYGGGDYIVTVQAGMWIGDDYDLVFCKRDTDIAHSVETVHSLEEAESMLRKYAPDARRWRKQARVFE